MIEKEDGSLRIKDFTETHLLEFPHGQRASSILHISKIHPDYCDLSGTGFFPGVLAQDLLSQRHSHVRLSRFPSLVSSFKNQKPSNTPIFLYNTNFFF
jgi:hypothetical protein